MKKTQDILGLPIITISDGAEVGKVKSIVINDENGAIDYIVVNSGVQILSPRVIPTGNILGIGEYALTIENKEAISDIGKISDAVDLLQKNVVVKGTKVLTKKGSLIGEIGDIYIDEDDDCKIVGLEYIADITQKKIKIIPRDSVITFGKTLVVVNDSIESELLDDISQLESKDSYFDVEKKNNVDADNDNQNGGSTGFDNDINAVNFTDEPFSNVDLNYEEAVEEVAGTEDFDYIDKSDNHTETNESTEQGMELPEKEFTSDGKSFSGEDGSSDLDANEGSQEESNAADLFEQRQRQYLIGRTATKTIADNSGNIIVSDGDLITDAVIDEAKNSGKLIELVMNNKA